MCAYGLNVLIGVAESCAHVSEQRPAISPRNVKMEDLPTPSTIDTMSQGRAVCSPKKNLAPKMAWIMFNTAFPAICTAFLPCFIKAGYHIEAGGILTQSALELHWSGFIGIIFAFLGSLWV